MLRLIRIAHFSLAYKIFPLRTGLLIFSMMFFLLSLVNFSLERPFPFNLISGVELRSHFFLLLKGPREDLGLSLSSMASQFGEGNVISIPRETLESMVHQYTLDRDLTFDGEMKGLFHQLRFDAYRISGSSSDLLMAKKKLERLFDESEVSLGPIQHISPVLRYWSYIMMVVSLVLVIFSGMLLYEALAPKLELVEEFKRIE